MHTLLPCNAGMAPPASMHSGWFITPCKSRRTSLHGRVAPSGWHFTIKQNSLDLEASRCVMNALQIAHFAKPSQDAFHSRRGRTGSKMGIPADGQAHDACTVRSMVPTLKQPDENARRAFWWHDGHLDRPRPCSSLQQSCYAWIAVMFLCLSGLRICAGYASLVPPPNG